ncbi:MAG: HtaA domain-containing protein [Cellulomonadaceae bacterium]
MAGKFTGAYVVFGKFADVWQPSAGAPSSARAGHDSKWAVPAESVATVGGAAAGAIELNADGTFETQLSIEDLDAAASGTYGVYTYPGGGAKYAPFETFTPITFADVAPEPEPEEPEEPSVDPVVTVSPSTDVDPTVANTFAVAGSGYADGIASASADGVYVGLVDSAKWPEGTAPNAADFIGVKFVPAVTVRDGAFTTQIVAEAGELDSTKNYVVATFCAHGCSMTDRSLDVRAPITFKASAPVDPEPTEPVDPVDPVDPEPVDPSVVAAAGSLAWAFKDSWNTYLVGIAGGSATPTNGAGTDSAGRYTFAQVAGGDFDTATGLGTIRYQGTVRFVSDRHGFDITLADPWVTVTASAVEVSALTSTSSTAGVGALERVVIARFTVPGGQPAQTASEWTWTNPAGTIADSVAPSDWSRYAGEAASPLSFSYGAPVEKPASKPSVRLGGAFTNGSISQGQTAQFEVTGLEPGTSVSAAVHSDPVTLGSLTADVNGSVLYTWTVPADFPATQHMLRVEAAGGVLVEQAFTVTEASAVGVFTPAVTETETAATCVARSVSGANLTWGVKDSFVSYVTGSVANGAISTSGTAQVGNDFRWSGGTGAYNVDAGKGRVAFSGGVTFTGHGGILDLTLSAPRLVLNGPGSATLVVNVNGTTMEGESLSLGGVAFATVNLSAAQRSADGSAVSYTGAPATLTAAGAQAFAGFYSAGEVLDPVSVTIPLGGDVECTSATGTLAATGVGAEGTALAAVLLVLLGCALRVARRRQAL